MLNDFPCFNQSLQRNLQYFGYLRRNPNDAPEPGLNFGGYNFWLGKLNEFNGDFARAEMVKAFLDSTEFRNRFAP
jgi:Domain of unknown function (DUF4214)